MAVVTKTIKVQSKGHDDVIDITGKVEESVSESKIKDGLANVSVVGSTASITTIEYEPNLVADIKKSLEEIIPSQRDWRHNQTWGDGNAQSHLRASVIGASKTFPIVNGELALGTWQQIVLIDHDIRGRSREIIVQIIGE